MHKPYVVIDAEILGSSIWLEAPHVKLVWLTMLILCDTEGYVGASVPGIAKHAGVTTEQAHEALSILLAPDPESRTKTNEGRRVEVVERGFRILNFLEQLERLSAERKKTRDRVRRFRERQASRTESGNVTETPRNLSNVTVAQGIGNRDNNVPTPPPGAVVGERDSKGEGARLPANPLLADRPKKELACYALIREINAIEVDRDPTEILMEAAGWKDFKGNVRSKVRIETMTDDHLIKTHHDLKSILRDTRRKHGTA